MLVFSSKLKPKDNKFGLKLSNIIFYSITQQCQIQIWKNAELQVVLTSALKKTCAVGAN
jgi:hypothetical protein